MERDIEMVVSRFRDEASNLFMAISADFERNAQKLNRLQDENVFQQMQGRYVQELKKQLAEAAEKTIGQYSGKVSENALRRELSDQIAYYVAEFLLKARSM